MGEPVLHSCDADGVRQLSLDNSARRNALTDGLLIQLDGALDQAVREGVRCLLLRGEGHQAFSSGYDVSTLAPGPAARPPPDTRLLSVIQHVEELAIPVVAFINGHAFGGGLDLAAACDIRVASVNARFGMPPARLGIAYAAAGLRRFTRLVGPGQARLLFFSAETLSAHQALRIGLVDEVEAPAVAEERAKALCQEIARNAPSAISVMRRTFQAIDRAGAPSIETELEAARVATFFSDEAREGLAAFGEKRAPIFKGR